MNELNGKRILLGVTGGIAAYKAAELVRLLKKNGADVRVVMTDSGAQFVSPVTLQALSGNPVHTSMWDQSIANGMPHIELSRDCDLILVAPATADFIAKLAAGRADDLLSTLCLARDCALMIAPAMNRQMWENPSTQRNIKTLLADGVHLVGPDSGEQACGEVGVGRMSEPSLIANEIVSWLQPKLLQNKNVIVTAGPTYEAIDAVRGITNASSGKMGYAVAQAAIDAGANVTLISGKTNLNPPTRARFISIISAQDMFDAVINEVDHSDIFISVAAVADFKVRNPSEHKIKKSQQKLSIEFDETPDILKSVASRKNRPFCVGFAAESQNVEEYARKKRIEKGIPLIAANLVTEALNSDDNSLVLIDEHGTKTLASSSKLEQARQLMMHISGLINNQ
ncbi:MAG: bifunctional phosphopantothenoylcysteine decarboxylase/phosphopantothenate--cysteine ligase CoaBC [Proteobacteria bacterium]|nr:bifunctional phosphopantothenoylcysteine decarboxylase/phosphopantothenate--cysteine ligase CoaBC [Pseudomonadota bacterium]MDA1012078.1 bifunctional phosphopantothenoylcysteine decarboxylase/phosphopantothenate--cysteine ligase CoaBC [Pseudomonadota bacterium]